MWHTFWGSTWAITTDLDRLGLLLWEAQWASRCAADDCRWLSGTTSSTQRLHGNYWMTRSEPLGFTMYMWRFPKMGVTPKSSILLGFSWGFSSINDPVIGYPHDYGNPAWKKVLSNTVRHWKCVPWAVVHWASRLKRGEPTQTIGVTSHLLRIYITHTHTTKSICHYVLKQKKTWQTSIQY